MTKRENRAKQANTGAAVTSSDASAADTLEQKVVAFAEQLGRMVGTVQAKTEGWMDREALKKQISSVRDGAADLLEQLAGAAKKASKMAPAIAASSNTKGRSGGKVDAPGKKHRKPMPADARAIAADAKTANMRSTKASMKTMKTRGRG